METDFFFFNKILFWKLQGEIYLNKTEVSKQNFFMNPSEKSWVSFYLLYKIL